MLPARNLCGAPVASVHSFDWSYLKAVRLRQRHGRERLTQKEVGERMGKSNDWVSKRESGKEKLTVEELQDLAQALGTVAPLLFYPPSMWSHPVLKLLRLIDRLEDQHTKFLDDYLRVMGLDGTHDDDAGDRPEPQGNGATPS